MKDPMIGMNVCMINKYSEGYHITVHIYGNLVKRLSNPEDVEAQKYVLNEIIEEATKYGKL